MFRSSSLGGKEWGGGQTSSPISSLCWACCVLGGRKAAAADFRPREAATDSRILQLFLSTDNQMATLYGEALGYSGEQTGSGAVRKPLP